MFSSLIRVNTELRSVRQTEIPLHMNATVTLVVYISYCLPTHSIQLHQCCVYSMLHCHQVVKMRLRCNFFLIQSSAEIITLGYDYKIKRQKYIVKFYKSTDNLCLLLQRYYQMCFTHGVNFILMCLQERLKNKGVCTADCETMMRQ